MSLKKYKRPDKNLHDLAPRRLTSDHERQYWPSETWIDDADRRNKRIEELLGDNLMRKNTIGNYLNRCR